MLPHFTQLNSCVCLYFSFGIWTDFTRLINLNIYLWLKCAEIYIHIGLCIESKCVINMFYTFFSSHNLISHLFSSRKFSLLKFFIVFFLHPNQFNLYFWFSSIPLHTDGIFFISALKERLACVSLSYRSVQNAKQNKTEWSRKSVCVME